MNKKSIILILCLSLCVGIGGCSANNKKIDKSTIEENSRKKILNNAYNEDSSQNTSIEQGNDDVNFTFDEVEVKKINNGFSLEYEGFNGACTWIMLESTSSAKEVLNISLNNNSDDVKLCLVSSDGVSKDLSIGENIVNLDSGKYRIKIIGKNSSNNVELTYDKNSTLTVKMNEYFNMGYDIDEEDGADDFFFNSFKNMINKDDIKSIDDISDDMILNKEGAYFDHSKKNNKGDCLELDYEGFTGVYKWCSIEAKKKASITVNIEGTIDKNTRLVLVQNDKSIQDITDGEKITIDKGKARIVLCGYKAKGNLKLSLTYDKKKIIISSSIFLSVK